MASSVESIWNQALLDVGESSRVSEESEASQIATWFRDLYDPARRFLLASADWKFAEEFSGELPSLEADNPEGRFEYWYKTPANALKIREVLHEATVRPRRGLPFTEWQHTAEGRVFATNKRDAAIRFTRDISDPGAFTTGFEQALVTVLASKISIPLKLSSDVKLLHEGRAARALSIAMSGETGQDPERADARWISDRFC